jgi:hypothetical protein
MAIPSSPSHDDRHLRLHRMAAEWGISSLPPVPPLTRPARSANTALFRSPSDDFEAEELLKRQAIQASSRQNGGTGSVRRNFTITKKKGWDPKEIFDALNAHVAAAGSPGVAEALIAMLVGAGGDVNIASSKTKTNLLTRRRSMESMERSRLLQKAIETGQVDMVRVLSPHADALTLDSSLPAAITTGNQTLVETLLRHGATARSASGEDAFRRLCMAGGHANVIALILASEGRPSPEVLARGMVDAAHKGCLETVLRLSRAYADDNLTSAAALRESILQCRVDIAYAILTGPRPPIGECLNGAFKHVFSHANIMPHDKLALADALLCSGAGGDIAASALLQAAKAGFTEMVELLVYHGASVEYDDAKLVRWAIQEEKASLVAQLLPSSAAFSPVRASECVACIPKTVTNTNRYTLLTVLLRKGAAGDVLNDALVEAVEAGDLATVELLLNPRFPGGQAIDARDSKRGPRGMAYDRHATASVDYRGGIPLQLAVLTVNIPMVQAMLSTQPSKDTLFEVFPNISSLATADRYHMAECLLSAGPPQRSINEALQVAVAEHPPRRDEKFIGLLLRHNADPSFGGGANIHAAVQHRDITLLETLLSSRPDPRAAASAIPSAMAVPDPEVRAHIMFLLLNAAGGLSGNEVGDALVAVLSHQPTEIKLFEMLLKQGMADVNYQSGAPLVLATRNTDPRILELLLQTNRASQPTLSAALEALADHPPGPAKAVKLTRLARLVESRTPFNTLLIAEVESLCALPAEQRSLEVLCSLLEAGADINEHDGAALSTAVGKAATQVADLLFRAKPGPETLAAALKPALDISDPMDRLVFTQKILQAGVSPAVANDALVYVVGAFPEDVPLVNILAAKAGCEDGEALCLAARKGKVEVVESLLRRGYTGDVVARAIDSAMKVPDTEARQNICTMLAKAGANPAVLSQALVQASAEGDAKLGKILLSAGASLEYSHGRALVDAAGSGSVEMLTMLLAGTTPRPDPLSKAVVAATQIGDLSRRYDIFQLLLSAGATGPAVDEQLTSAVRYGEDGRDLASLLLAHGANPDWDGGAAVRNCTRAAYIPGLRLLLGLDSPAKDQRKPGQATLSKALRASWRLADGPRYEVIHALFEAGLEAGDEVNVALNKAVNAEEANIALVRLLLKHGGNPLADGCKTLVDVVQKMDGQVVDMCLEGREVRVEDLRYAFETGFAVDRAEQWLCEDGLGLAGVLLRKTEAVGEAGSRVLVVAIANLRGDKADIAKRFLELLVQHHVDVNYNHGLPLQAAAKIGDADVIRQLLELKPNEETLSMAFPFIFDLELGEDDTLALIRIFGEYQDGEDRLDVMFQHPTSELPVFRAVGQHPRSTKILTALLDAGYYHDQGTMAVVHEEVDEPEAVSLLFWALLQPQKRISSNVIELLIQRGAKVDFETKKSKRTPLMLAIESRRHDLVKSLILKGAEVDITDITGNTPLTMATRVGGDLGTMMMQSVLAADPSKNDGSLHNAARELNLPAMQVLMKFGHDPDFPSPLHGGRSALGEICLNATEAGELSAAREKQMEKSIEFLIESGSDLGIQTDGKSALLLALESPDPIPTTRALLKMGMWKIIDHRANLYTDGTHTFSPTMYLARVLPHRDTHDELDSLLRKYRAKDIFFANSGPQPPDAVGMPEEVARAERERLLRAEAIAREKQDHADSLARLRDAAAAQNAIMAERAALLEAQRDREAEASRAREEAAFALAVKQARATEAAALEHKAALSEAELNRTRLLEDTQAVYARQRRVEEAEAARELAAVRVREGEEMARLARAEDERFRERVREQRRLIDAQGQLAQRIGGGPGQRQIGFVTGEVP